MAFSAGETDLTLSWGDGGKYLAGTKTFKVKVNALKPTLSYSAETCEVILDEEPYEFPVLTADNKGLKVVYSSSNEDVALFVDGKLVIGDPGTTTITAKIEAVPGHNEGAEASYELTVKPAGAVPSPVFSVASGEVVYGTEVSISAAKGDIYYGTSVENAVKYEAPFTLNTIGEVTYVAYAKTANGQSETVSVTYNVVPAKAAFEFKSATGETMMGNLLDINVLLNNPEGLNYTLSTDNAEVARVALNAPERIWLMAPGNVTITATPVATDTYTAEATTYALTVKEEVGEMEEVPVTFDFPNEDYGLTRSTASYLKNGAVATNDPISIKLTKKESSTTGWRLYSDGLRAYKNSDVAMTFTTQVGTITGISFEGVKSGVVTGYTVNGGAKVDLSNKPTSFSVKCNGSEIVLALTVPDNGTLGVVRVTYTRPGVTTAHCHANLAFDGYREALVNELTVAEPATMSPDATAAVEYIVLDGEGNATEEVVVEPDEDGSIIIAADVEEEAEYTLVAYIDPYNEANGKYYPAVVETPLYVREVIMPAELYLHGHFFNRYYDLTAPVKMEKKGRDFVATDILIGGNPEHAGDAYDYVFTTHKLDRAAAESSMMRAAAAAGSHQWDVLTEGTVYHNEIDGALTATAASDVTSAADITPINAGKEGLYQITVNFDDPKTPTYKAVFTDITTGIEGVTVDKNAEAVYYDLTGRRVANPSAGVFIRVQGGKAEKIMIK
ncbi:MAG: hypothetical protein K2K22_01400 [Muribaculaceae bacterium]|nr:hypothetical protein [Muribaculaceae bacterium]